jgi:hypothetical protein
VLHDTQVDHDRRSLSLYMARDDANAALEIARSCGFAWAERDALHLLNKICLSMGDHRNGEKHQKQALAADKGLELDVRTFRTKRPSKWRDDY